MHDSTDNLTPNQVSALAALLAGRTVRTAAKAAGVDPGTVHRWLHEPDFQAALTAGRRELAGVALAQIQGLTETAVSVIKDLMTDKRAPASVRLRAAQIIIESTLKWLELEDLDARLRALEERDADARSTPGDA
jgi:hypothetical protein